MLEKIVDDINGVVTTHYTDKLTYPDMIGLGYTSCMLGSYYCAVAWSYNGNLLLTIDNDEHDVRIETHRTEAVYNELSAMPKQNSCKSCPYVTQLDEETSFCKLLETMVVVDKKNTAMYGLCGKIDNIKEDAQCL